MDGVALDDAMAVLVAADDWPRLVRLFEDRRGEIEPRDLGRHWRRCVDALEGVLNRVAEPDERSRLMTEIGRLWEERLGNPDQALLNYQAAFRVDRGNDQAGAGARRVLAEQGAWLMVARNLEQALQVPRDDRDRARLLAEAAWVYRRKLGDEKSADALASEAEQLDPEVEEPDSGGRLGADWRERIERLEASLYGTRGAERAERLLTIAALLVAESPDPTEAEPYLAEALQLAPRSPRAARVAASLHLARGDVDAYRAALEGIGRSPGDPAARADAYAELARFLVAEASEPAAGLAAVRKALELSPRHAAALALAREVHAERGEWRELASVLERALADMQRGHDELQLRGALAELYWHRLRDMEAAETHFRRVRLADERDRTMLQFYAEYHAASGDWSASLARSRTLLHIVDDAGERARLATGMAHVAEVELKDPDRAIDVWAAVLSADPSDRRAREELRRLLREAGRWNRLVDLLKDELAATPATPPGPRIALLLEMAAIYRDHFSLPVLAGNAYAAVLELDPANAEAGTALAERYEKTGRWSELAALHRARAEALREPRLAADAWRVIGRIERGRTGNLHAAAHAFEQVLALAPGDSEAFDVLEGIYAVTSPVDLLRITTARLEFVTDAEAEETLRTLLEHGCGGSQVSLASRIPLLQRLATLAPDDPSVAVELEAAYRDAGRWDDLVSALETRTTAAFGPGDVEAVRELGRLLSAQRLGIARELDVWRRLLELAPGDPEATERVCNLLAESRDWDALEAFAAERGQWGRLVGPLREEAERSGDAELFRRLARALAERLDDRTGQIAALERAREIDPGHVATARELEAAYAAAGDPAGRSSVLHDLVILLDGAEARNARWQLAGLLADELGRPGGAYDVLVPLLVDAPDDETVCATLRALAEASDRTGDLLATLKRTAATLPASSARASVYATIASLAEGPADAPLEAADFLERLFAEDPSPEILDRLAALYERAGAWERLDETLTRALGAAEGARREDIAWRLVGVRLGPLGAADDPVGALAAVGVENAEPERLAALRRLLRSHERWATMAAVACAELAVAAGDAARDARLALGRALLEFDRAGAVDQLVALCDQAPESDEASTAAGLLVGSADRGPAASRWAPAALRVLLHHQRWDEAVAALHAAVEAGVDRAGSLRTMARVREEHLGDVAGAFAAMTRLGIEATDADRERTEELARRSGRLSELVGIWRTELDANTVPGRLHQLATILEDDLGELAAARGIWRRAYEADPGDSVAAAALERLNRTLTDHIQLAEHLIQTAESAPRDEKAARLREAGQILATLPDRMTEAIPLFERALELAPRDLVAFGELERLYRAAGDAMGLVDLLRRKVRVHADRPDVQAAAFRTLGDAIREGAGDPAAALHAYRRALETVPGDPETIRALADFVTAPGAIPSAVRRTEAADLVEHAYDVADDWASLLSFIERRIAVEDRRTAADLHRKAARLLDIVGDDPMRAFHHWGAVVDAGDADAEAVDRYVALGRTLGAEREVATLVERCVADGTGDPSAMRLALVDLQIARGARDEAMRHLEAAVIDDPRDTSALERLERLYREQGDPEDLAAILARRARTLPAAPARLALREAAELYRVVGDATREADCLVRLQRLEPEDTELAARLASSLQALERWEDLASLLASMALHAPPSDVATMRLDRARILEERLDDVPRAVAAYKSVLALEPDNRSAAERLVVLYGTLGLRDEAREMEALLAATGPDPRR